MTRLTALQVNIARTGLAIGDSAEVFLAPEGRIGVAAPVLRHILGVFAHRAPRVIGFLGAEAEGLIAPALIAGQSFRIRIVGLTPEHLGPEPEVFVSIWGDAKRLLVPPPLTIG